MASVKDMQDVAPDVRADEEVGVQTGGYLLELSLDWIVERASENVHELLGESHVTLIHEPFGNFVQSQALHDLRNFFSRLSGTTGIARAYRVRLTDEHEHFDIAFQLIDGRVLLEAVPTAETIGESFGSVAGLISGLADTRGEALFDSATRRMRALTGYDRVTLVCGDHRRESSRGEFARAADMSHDVPILVADTQAPAVRIFPRPAEDTSVAAALMRAPDSATLERLRSAGIGSSLRVPFRYPGGAGEFRCDNRSARAPSFEVAAAAELFAQMFAMQLEVDRLKGASAN